MCVAAALAHRRLVDVLGVRSAPARLRGRAACQDVPCRSGDHLSLWQTLLSLSHGLKANNSDFHRLTDHSLGSCRLAVLHRYALLSK